MTNYSIINNYVITDVSYVMIKILITLNDLPSNMWPRERQIQRKKEKERRRIRYIYIKREREICGIFVNNKPKPLFTLCTWER